MRLCQVKIDQIVYEKLILWKFYCNFKVFVINSNSVDFNSGGDSSFAQNVLTVNNGVIILGTMYNIC